MSVFAVSHHVRCDSAGRVAAALRELGATRAAVSEPASGWVSVWDEACARPDLEATRRLGAALSERLRCPVVAFLVHDSELSRYWLFDRGRLEDEYDSCPDYFRASPKRSERLRLAGDAGRLARYCLEGIGPLEVQEILDAEPLFEEERVEALAELLGIAPERASASFANLAPASGGTEAELEAELARAELELAESDAAPPVRRSLALAEPLAEPAAGSPAGSEAASEAPEQPGEPAASRVGPEAGLAAAGDEAADRPEPGPPALPTLLAAARAGDVALLRQLLGDGHDPRERDAKGRSALHWAVASARTDYDALTAAQRREWWRRNAQARAAAAERGEDPARAFERQLKLERPPDDEQRIERLVGELLEAGEAPDPRDAAGATPLLLAAELGLVAVVRRLIAEGASPSAATREGETPLHLAAAWGLDATVAELLGAGAPAGHRDAGGETPRDRARQRGYEQTLRLLAGD